MPIKSRTVEAAALPRGTGSSAKRAAKMAQLPAAQRILGIDPGLHRTGYGLVEIAGMAPALPRFHTAESGTGTPSGPRLQTARRGSATLLEAGLLRAKADDAFERRLTVLHEGLAEVLREHEPDIVVVEDLFATYAHPRSALLMAHARGVLMLAAGQAGVPVHTFTPNEVKQVVAGNGHATKAAVEAAVRARLNLTTPLHPPDVADALAIALCFVLRQGMVARSG